MPAELTPTEFPSVSQVAMENKRKQDLLRIASLIMLAVIGIQSLNSPDVKLPKNEAVFQILSVGIPLLCSMYYSIKKADYDQKRQYWDNKYRMAAKQGLAPALPGKVRRALVSEYMDSRYQIEGVRLVDKNMRMF